MYHTVNCTEVRTKIKLYHHKFIASYRVYFITLILSVLTSLVVDMLYVTHSSAVHETSSKAVYTGGAFREGINYYLYI